MGRVGIYQFIMPEEQGAKLIFSLDLLCEKQESSWKHF